MLKAFLMGSGSPELLCLSPDLQLNYFTTHETLDEMITLDLQTVAGQTVVLIFLSIFSSGKIEYEPLTCEDRASPPACFASQQFM